jgi:hypothetical protein
MSSIKLSPLWTNDHLSFVAASLCITHPGTYFFQRQKGLWHQRLHITLLGDTVYKWNPICFQTLPPLLALDLWDWAWGLIDIYRSQLCERSSEFTSVLLTMIRVNHGQVHRWGHTLLVYFPEPSRRVWGESCDFAGRTRLRTQHTDGDAFLYPCHMDRGTVSQVLSNYALHYSLQPPLLKVASLSCNLLSRTRKKELLVNFICSWLR